MTTELSFRLNVDNIIPHADPQSSQKVVATWKSASQLFNDFKYECIKPSSGNLITQQISLDMSDVLNVLENAITQSGSLDSCRKHHIENRKTRVNASLAFTLKSEDEAIQIGDAYQIASTFLQQLYLAMNLAYPGSCQLLGVEFEGENSHLYEAQSFDSKLFYDARMSAHQQGWPNLQTLELPTTWNWISKQNFSHSDIAISDCNKVLFNMLKLAQQRHRYGSRSALLAAQQIELLLGTRHSGDVKRLRARTRLILDDIPESADCFVELFQLRANLFHGQHPVRRPALICNSPSQERREQIASHNTTIELAAGIITGLIQRLVKTNESKFQFKEILI